VSQYGLPAFIVLVTHFESGDAKSNPWEDAIDLSNGQITYWGDSKWHPTKRLDDFAGNAVLRSVHDAVSEHGLAVSTPILHFSKPSKGVVRFNGLCVLEHLDLSWFFDHDRPVRNYRARLRILDCEAVRVDWLQSRIRATDAPSVDSHKDCPRVWKDVAKYGRIAPLDIIKRSIRSRQAQVPDSGTDDSCVLEQLVALEPFQFEQVVVALFGELSEVTHHIEGTKSTGDGGFDFFGTFKLQRPLVYEIPFRGEVKRYSSKTAVSPKDVSRLVARLGRREYGIFVTTSYFTENAQREVICDDYPIHLIAGRDLVDMMRQMRIANGRKIRNDWLDAVTKASLVPSR
jgi:hypothetical protein